MIPQEILDEFRNLLAGAPGAGSNISWPMDKLVELIITLDRRVDALEASLALTDAELARLSRGN